MNEISSGIPKELIKDPGLAAVMAIAEDPFRNAAKKLPLQDEEKQTLLKVAGLEAERVKKNFTQDGLLNEDQIALLRRRIDNAYPIKWCELALAGYSPQLPEHLHEALNTLANNSLTGALESTHSAREALGITSSITEEIGIGVYAAIRENSFETLDESYDLKDPLVRKLFMEGFVIGGILIGRINSIKALHNIAAVEEKPPSEVIALYLPVINKLRNIPVDSGPLDVFRITSLDSQMEKDNFIWDETAKSYSHFSPEEK